MGANRLAIEFYAELHSNIDEHEHDSTQATLVYKGKGGQGGVIGSK